MTFLLPPGIKGLKYNFFSHHVNTSTHCFLRILTSYSELYIIYHENNIHISDIRKGSSITYDRKIFRKTNISNPLTRTRTCAYQRNRNVSFSGNFAYIINGWPLTVIITLFNKTVTEFSRNKTVPIHLPPQIRASWRGHPKLVQLQYCP